LALAKALLQLLHVTIKYQVYVGSSTQLLLDFPLNARNLIQDSK